MTNHTATAAPATADRLAAALDAATEPLTQAALAAAAGVGRSTATTWLGQQVAKGLAVRHDQEKGPALFARPLPACDVCLSTGPHTAGCSEGPTGDEEAEALMVAESDAAAEAELDRLADAAEEAARAAAPEVPAEVLAEWEAEDAAEVAQFAAAEAQAMGAGNTAPAACHCGDDEVGHVHPAKKEKAATATRAPRAAGGKDTAWAAAEEALRAAGAEGMGVEDLWKVLEAAGLAFSGAYALVNAKRTEGALTTAVEARKVRDRRYALAGV